MDSGIIFWNASFQRKEEFRGIYEYFLANNIQVSSPIFDFKQTDNSDYHKLMEYAFTAIKKSDILVADATYKEIGIGIEVGYAKANGIPIIYIHLDGSEISTTILGTSTTAATYTKNNYQNIIDLCNTKLS